MASPFVGVRMDLGALIAQASLRRQRVFRDRTDPLALSDDILYERYRFGIYLRHLFNGQNIINQWRKYRRCNRCSCPRPRPPSPSTTQRKAGTVQPPLPPQQLKTWVHHKYVLVHQIKNLGAPVHPRKKLVWSPAFMPSRVAMLELCSLFTNIMTSVLSVFN